MHIAPERNLTVDHVRQPEGTTLVGYAALIRVTGAKVPYPDPVCVVSDGRPRPDKDSNFSLKGRYGVYVNSYAVGPDFGGHLTFALKHERLDLLALKRIFMAVQPDTIAQYVDRMPTSGSRRQAWFLYEWLTGRTANVDLTKIGGNYVDAIDPAQWNTGNPVPSPRHRVRDNMPGTPAFCPLSARGAGTLASAEDGETLAALAERRAAAATETLSGTTMNRLAKRLLLKDSKSTFLIEREIPSPDMTQKWSEVLAGAGKTALDVELLVRLQKLLMSERQFVALGLRRGGVFLGDRVENSPVPQWIGARPEDVRGLMDGIVAANARMTAGGTDPIAQAAAVGFGMVFVHPFEDGNGRIHRYLLQHVLGERGIVPMGITLPLSKAIWHDEDGYAAALKAYDGPRLPFIDWKATSNGNVEVTNDTADLYRFFDATEQSGFLARCMDGVFVRDIPDEIVEMKRRDRTVVDARDIVRDIPEQMVDKFAMLVLQNHGTLSKGKRKKEFAQLTDDEVVSLQEMVCEVYGIEPPEPATSPTP